MLELPAMLRIRFSRLVAGVTFFSFIASLAPLAAESLRELAPFAVGVGISDQIAKRPQDWPLLKREFSVITPENCMKPASIQPQAGVWRWEIADAFVNFALSNDLKVVGHCLVWAKDDRTPSWFCNDGAQPASREVLLARMKKHIEAVVGRYRGKIAMWDVLNEALDDGTNYLRSSCWSRACAEDFIVEAFKSAAAADPGALLIYNDYNNELPAKFDKMVRLLKTLRAHHAPVHAIGLQGHYELDLVPFEAIEKTLSALKSMGIKVVISELDIDVIPRARWWANGGAEREALSKVNPYRDGCPPEVLERQAAQYARLFAIFKKHSDQILRITFWNLHDGQSWLNSFPWKRENYPLLFDRQRKPKPAYDAVLDELKR